jgi:hypothetical protein
MRRAQEKERDDAVARGELKAEDVEELPLPAISYVGIASIIPLPLT